MMNNHEALIQEFIARKAQILNLETRLFWLVIAIQGLFLLFYIFQRQRLEKERALGTLALMSFGVLFFEMVAINSKMGLISMYLRQMEAYMNTLGFQGVLWETKALDAIIFVTGNAFTLPAGMAILILFSEAVYAIRFTAKGYLNNKVWLNILTGFSIIILALLILKSITVDFARPLPQIFTPPQIDSKIEELSH